MPAPRLLVHAAAAVIGPWVRDVVLTRDEIEGLSAGLCVSDSPHPPSTTTKVSEWLAQHGDTLGRAYASELQRHYS